MSLDSTLLENLLYQEEGSALDFKEKQYPFDGAKKDQKGELLKDILAFANSWRQTTAYILVGVEEVKGGRSRIIGITDHLDDAKLHQFVNSKTQQSVEFSYFPFHTEGSEIGVIEIPLQQRPIYIRRDYGKLNADVVYIRDGSSTRPATPDEIAKMGVERVLDDPPQFILEWADTDSRAVFPSPHTVCSLFLNPPLSPDEISSPRPRDPFANISDKSPRVRTSHPFRGEGKANDSGRRLTLPESAVSTSRSSSTAWLNFSSLFLPPCGVFPEDK